MPYFEKCITSYSSFSYKKTDAMAFVSQLDLQTSTWFDYSAKNSSRTVADLACSSSSLQLYVPSSFLFRVQQCRTPSTNCTRSCSVELLHRNSVINNVELHRQLSPSVYVSKFNNVELHRQSYTSSLPVNNVEPPSVQQCRTPSTVQADPSCVQS